MVTYDKPAHAGIHRFIM